MKPIKAVAIAAGLAALAVSGQAFAANMLAATYFEAPTTGDADFGNSSNCCSQVFTNEAPSTLGVDGFPVYNTASGDPINDVNGVTGEIEWWSHAMDANITQTGTGTITLPYANNNMYPPNSGGSNDSSGYEAAIFHGTLYVPIAENVTFDLMSDDDAILALGNTVIDQIGGVHPAATNNVTEMLNAGTYSLNLFYADRYQTQAVLDFGVVGDGVTLGVPEPATWAMLIAGFGMIGFTMRRRRSFAVA
ncbi:MAG: PEPxxWA-CTERM sorting domain-containing protein [Caulobacteraceae bacterium]